MILQEVYKMQLMKLLLKWDRQYPATNFEMLVSRYLATSPKSSKALSIKFAKYKIVDLLPI